MEQKDFEAMAPQLRQRIVGMVRKLSADSGDTDLADDVAQDTLLKLWSMRDRLDAYTSVEALAMVIARNRAIDLLKRVSALRSCDIADIDISDTAVSAEDAIISTESENRAMSLLASLPSGQQAVLRMRHVDGMEISEIAAVTGSTPNAIRVTLSRARQNIKELYLKTTEKNMNSIDLTNIRQAIERFLAAETTLAEEEAIYRFYASHPSGTLPADVERMRGMFAWYGAGLDESLDPVAQTASRPSVALPPLRRWQWLSVAASLAVLLTVGFSVFRPGDRVEETAYVVINGEIVTDPAIVESESMKLQAIFDRAERKFASVGGTAVTAPSLEDQLDMDNPIVRDIVNRYNNFN